MGKCAFCTHSGKLSAEHIFARWVRDLFPTKKIAFYIGGTAVRSRRFEAETIDWNAKVACANCNSTWMSDIEVTHGKPVMTPLIVGEIGVPITREIARSIAIYAFKTSVVANHADRGTEQFFSARLLYAFRSRLDIPANVNIWTCGIKNHRGAVRVQTVYYSGQLPAAFHWQMYVFTCAIGHFVTQVVAVKQIGEAKFRPLSGFEGIGIPIWPGIRPNQTWPGRYVLDGGDDFEKFANRWARVQPILD